MFKKLALSAALAASAVATLPTAALAQGYVYDDRGGYDRRYEPRDDRRYDPRDDRRYAERYDNRQYDDEYHEDDRRHCNGSGTTGLILGAAAGALAGRAIDKSRC